MFCVVPSCYLVFAGFYHQSILMVLIGSYQPISMELTSTVITPLTINLPAKVILECLLASLNSRLSSYTNKTNLI